MGGPRVLAGSPTALRSCPMPALVDTTIRLLSQEPLAGRVPTGELFRLAVFWFVSKKVCDLKSRPQVSSAKDLPWTSRCLTRHTRAGCEHFQGRLQMRCATSIGSPGFPGCATSNRSCCMSAHSGNPMAFEARPAAYLSTPL